MDIIREGGGFHVIRGYIRFSPRKLIAYVDDPECFNAITCDLLKYGVDTQVGFIWMAQRWIPNKKRPNHPQPSKRKGATGIVAGLPCSSQVVVPRSNAISSMMLPKEVVCGVWPICCQHSRNQTTGGRRGKEMSDQKYGVSWLHAHALAYVTRHFKNIQTYSDRFWGNVLFKGEPH